MPNEGSCASELEFEVDSRRWEEYISCFESDQCEVTDKSLLQLMEEHTPTSFSDSGLGDEIHLQVGPSDSNKGIIDPSLSETRLSIFEADEQPTSTFVCPYDQDYAHFCLVSSPSLQLGDDFIQEPQPDIPNLQDLPLTDSSPTETSLIPVDWQVFLKPRDSVPFPGTHNYNVYDSCSYQELQERIAENYKRNRSSLIEVHSSVQFDSSQSQGFCPDPPIKPMKHLKDLLVPKRQRLIFSDDQCLKLKEVFSKKPYLTKNERNQLAKELDITETNVAVWFKNQRSKKKKLGSPMLK